MGDNEVQKNPNDGSSHQPIIDFYYDTSINPNRMLIDPIESYELTDEKIDRVNDGAVNTPADMRVFLEAQKAQAKNMLAHQADDLKKFSKNPKNVDEKLKEANKMVDALAEYIMDDLDNETLKICVSKLSDIVGFVLKLDSFQQDQFGLKKRYAGRLLHEYKGYAGYEDERVLSSGKHEKWIPGIMDEVGEAEKLKKLTTNPAEVAQVVEEMKKFGEARYEQFDTRGPVLVIVPEVHYNPAVIKNNFEMLVALKSHMAFLASEGFQGQAGSSKLGLSTMQDTLDEIAAYRIGISSEAMAHLFSQEIKIFGVEDDWIQSIIRGKIRERENGGLTETKSEINPNQRKPDFLKVPETNKELIQRSQLLYKLYPSSLESSLLINYRNSIWLERIINHLLFHGSNDVVGDNRTLADSTNIVFLVCGGGHEPNLGQQAKSLGFSGVIHFEAAALGLPPDEKIYEVYEKNER